MTEATVSHAAEQAQEAPPDAWPMRAARALEGARQLDGVAEAVAAAGGGLVSHGVIKQALSGRWLGHRLHPPLTDVTIAAWLSALILDLSGGDRAASQRLVGIGALAALPTALAGLSDWTETSGPARRVGLVHALGNSTALLCQLASWRARRRGEHARGRGLSFVASPVLVASGYLGGHLSHTLGVGVERAAPPV